MILIIIITIIIITLFQSMSTIIGALTTVVRSEAFEWSYWLKV